MFQNSFKSFFESIPMQKMVSEVLKTFLYSAFWPAGQWGRGKGCFPPSNATGSIKLTRSNPYRLYLIENNDWGRGLMEQYLS